MMSGCTTLLTVRVLTQAPVCSAAVVVPLHSSALVANTLDVLAHSATTISTPETLNFVTIVLAMATVMVSQALVNAKQATTVKTVR